MVIKDVDINYVDYGAKSNPIVLLHGWGQNIEMMQGLGNQFINTNRIIIVDLPGYGKSEEPKEVWTVDDYVLFLKELLDKLHVDNPIIIGHSFGGKIGLLYATKYNVKKLICLASPYKKNVKKLSLKTKLLKAAKKIPVLNKLYAFSIKYEQLTPQQQVLFLKEADIVFDAFGKVPDALWEEEYQKYMEILNKYKDIKITRWESQ